MKIYITLDYELFFGPQNGTVQQCMITPTAELLKILDPLGVKLTLFVDAGFIHALEQEKDKYPELANDYALLEQQLKSMAQNGHGIALHIHPHWEDTNYAPDKGWQMNTKRYRMNHFSADEALAITTKYSEALERISGIPQRAYRAGGWSVQPIAQYSQALLARGVKIDSSVFPQGYYDSDQQQYDFRAVAPFSGSYKFSERVDAVDANGEFTEVPISSMKVMPWFFWKFLAVKFKKSPIHKAFGDGAAIAMTKANAIRLLTRPSYSVVSMDGFKASLLPAIYKKYSKKSTIENPLDFVILGHPKAFSRYSLERMKEFVSLTHSKDEYATF